MIRGGDSRVTPGLQEYLTAIYRLKKRGNNVVRVKDLAEEMGVKLSSVTDAIKRLSRLGLVSYERYSYIDLTPDGEKIASSVASREEVFFDLLTKILSIDEREAWREACWIEHGVSDEVTRRISLLMSFLDNCVKDFKERFERFIYSGSCGSTK